MWRKMREKLNKKKKGFISIVYVVMLLGAIVVLGGVLTVYQHQLIVRNFEAAADLAAVESLRQAIDEPSLRNEVLAIKEDKLDELRDSFLKKIRNHLPSSSYEILRVEIPTIDANGVVTIPAGDIKTVAFPNSSAAFSNESTITNPSTGIARTSRFIGGSNSDNCAMELAKVSGNLAVSGIKKKDSYILTSKVTIVFKTNSSTNKMAINMLNYVNILSGNSRQIVTRQIDEGIIAVTIQAIGEVVLR